MSRYLQTLKFALLVAVACLAVSTARAASDSDNLSSRELENLAEPIALYPDMLLQVILPASTYPDQIVDAALLIKTPADAKKIKSQTWDASVKSVANYPGVLKMMFSDLEWTTSLGRAFVDQNRELLDAIQRLRGKAEALGNLKSDKGQKVTQQQAPDGNTYITIESADPQVVYVPTSTTTVYEEHDSSTSALVPLATFGIGMAVGAAMADDDDDHYYYGGGGGFWYGGNNNVDHWLDNRRAAWEDHNDRAWDRQDYRQDARSDRRDFRQDQIDSGNWKAPTEQQRQAAKQNVEQRRSNFKVSSAEARSRADAARSSYSGGSSSRSNARSSYSGSSSSRSNARSNYSGSAFSGYSSGSYASRASSRGSMSRGSFGGGGGRARSGGGRRR